MPIPTCRRVIYYAPGDEAAFFFWLDSIKAIRKVVGVGDSLQLHVASRLPDKALRELLILFYRYRIDMTQLAQFKSPSNRKWFAARKTYWHDRVFRATPDR
jgi:hypothetical protein